MISLYFALFTNDDSLRTLHISFSLEFKCRPEFSESRLLSRAAWIPKTEKLRIHSRSWVSFSIVQGETRNMTLKPSRANRYNTGSRFVSRRTNARSQSFPGIRDSCRNDRNFRSIRAQVRRKYTSDLNYMSCAIAACTYVDILIARRNVAIYPFRDSRLIRWYYISRGKMVYLY